MHYLTPSLLADALKEAKDVGGLLAELVHAGPIGGDAGRGKREGEKTDPAKYHLDPATGRYVDKDGKPVPDLSVREAVSEFLDGVRAWLTDLGKRLIEGAVTIGKWFASAVRKVAVATVLSVAVAAGGMANLGAGSQAVADKAVGQQINYLQRFRSEIEAKAALARLPAGKAPPDPAIPARTGGYGRSPWGPFNEERRKVGVRLGLTEERRHLWDGKSATKDASGYAGHGDDATCEECRKVAEKGWQPHGTLPAIGSLTCVTNCRCWFEFRRPPARSARSSAQDNRAEKQSEKAMKTRMKASDFFTAHGLRKVAEDRWEAQAADVIQRMRVNMDDMDLLTEDGAPCVYEIDGIALKKKAAAADGDDKGNTPLPEGDAAGNTDPPPEDTSGRDGGAAVVTRSELKSQLREAEDSLVRRLSQSGNKINPNAGNSQIGDIRHRSSLVRSRWAGENVEIATVVAATLAMQFSPHGQYAAVRKRGEQMLRDRGIRAEMTTVDPTSAGVTLPSQLVGPAFKLANIYGVSRRLFNKPPMADLQTTTWYPKRVRFTKTTAETGNTTATNTVKIPVKLVAKDIRVETKMTRTLRDASMEDLIDNAMYEMLVDYDRQLDTDAFSGTGVTTTQGIRGIGASLLAIDSTYANVKSLVFGGNSVDSVTAQNIDEMTAVVDENPEARGSMNRAWVMHPRVYHKLKRKNTAVNVSGNQGNNSFILLENPNGPNVRREPGYLGDLWGYPVFGCNDMPYAAPSSGTDVYAVLAAWEYCAWMGEPFNINMFRVDESIYVRENAIGVFGFMHADIQFANLGDTTDPGPLAGLYLTAAA